ncbi:plastocyanin/azurin family copper-binding protein [Nodularia harveyana UHCC-0300]|uniref:Plastocyanin/azurin family copper-binding protein n=1 Tax=Nodularia harveyana UHCC-0300 TaxID=2974287 RepID=A0ABU5UG76_9CYAN|nr:plastocyanin/azurin family copper-binding protein [Nodularia harveyana]MEA5581991.1 plastocyanin/azurin family copper-binding protein [Nodularia harveyana UHCC-0300]
MTWLFKKVTKNLYLNLSAVFSAIRQLTLIVLLLCLGFVNHDQAIAANFTENPLKQPATEITISLGNSANELKFEPNHLEFEPGKRYLLHLHNPSQLKHYFTAKDFADAIWTQKVQAGKVEVKGAIHELELKPGGEAEWVFLPIKPGSYNLHCSIPGHTEAGMTGEITIH